MLAGFALVGFRTTSRQVGTAKRSASHTRQIIVGWVGIVPSDKGRGDSALVFSRAISVPFAVRCVENDVHHAICCAVSCCSYVFTRIRFLPRSPFFKFRSLCHSLQYGHRNWQFTLLTVAETPRINLGDFTVLGIPLT